MPDQVTSLKREVVLLLIGAIISAGTASVTTYFNEKGEHRRNSIEKKFSINDQLAKDIGSRLFLTTEIYKRKRDKDTALQYWLR